VENVKARFAAVTTFSFAHNEPMYIAATSQIVLAQNIGYLNELTAGAPPHSEGERRGGDEERRGGRERKKEGDKAKGGNPRNGIFRTVFFKLPNFIRIDGRLLIAIIR